MNFRFRKTIPIIPGILRFTVSKKGYSLNLTLGPLSKSWGNIRNTTTFDAPGVSGIFWKKETSANKKREENQAADVLHDKAYKQIFLLSLWASVILWGFGLWQIYNPFGDCNVTGNPAATFSFLIAGQVFLFLVLFRGMKVARSIGGLIIIALICYLQYKLFGYLISPDLNCK